ncbi:MAG TPA: insulinase family protein [Candidatus Acidoferrales bacterium]|nr:insulinase family protein [Candidatus Acidoferrales bacterium]
MKMLRSFVYGLSFLLSVVVTQTQAQQIFKLDQSLATDSSATIGKLDNGLTYYIKENRKPEKRADLRLVVKAGSVLEDDDQQGLAHFVEHMAFHGTKSFPKHELANFLEKSGIRFGPEVNAYTDFDETWYILQVPTDSPAVMKTGFQILEEWAHAVTFNDSDIEKERGVVREEWRLGRGADERIFRQQCPYLFYKSRYAERIPIGKIGIIDSCPHDAIRRFYRDWYRPDLMAVIAVGDFNKGEIEQLIKDHFSSLKNPPNERERAKYSIPDHKDTLVSIATDKELSRTSISVTFLRNAHGSRTVSDYRNDIISGLYDRMFNARLSEIVLKPNPAFIYAYGGDGRFLADRQAYSLGAGVADTTIVRGLQAVMVEANRVREYGFTSSELERQKNESLRWMQKAYDERDKTESSRYVNEYQRNFINDEPIPGIAAELALYKQLLPGITAEEVNDLASERMRPGNSTILVAAPEKDSVRLPSENEVLAVVSAAGALKLEPYVDRVSSEPLIAKLPVPGKIVAEKKIPSIGITEWRLSNGARVVLKPTDFKNDEILFSSYAPGGSSLVDDSDYLSAIAATGIIAQAGIGDFDAVTLNKKLAGKVVSVSPMISEIYEGLRGNSSPKDIETLFQLVYLYSTSPRRDTAAFSAYMTRWKESLQNVSANPQAVFNDTIRVTMSNYHFRGRPITTGLLDEVRLDEALSIYKSRFADFSSSTFFFVGSFQVDSLKPFAEQYLASLPSLNRGEKWKDIGMEPPKGVIAKEVRKGVEPKSLVNLTFTGPFVWSQQNRYDFEAMMGILNIRLREVLREDKGATYGVRVNGNSHSIPKPEYSITISWGCSPDRVDELVKQVLIQIDSLKLKGPDSVYIQKEKELERRSLEVNLKQNGYWMSRLYGCYLDNEDPEVILNYPKLIDGLTEGAIQSAAKEYFSMDNYVKVVLYPEK